MNVRQITLGSCIAAQPAQVDRNTTGDPDFLTLPKFVLAMALVRVEAAEPDLRL